jgi:hypothetical protein
MSITSKLYKLRRMVWHKSLPDFVYRMDDRPAAFVKAHGLQPKGLRTDGAPGQFGPVNNAVTVIEHVKKTSDTTGASINTVDPWISFFAWHALQPISGDVMAFMHGYREGQIYMVDTATAIANGYNFGGFKSEVQHLQACKVRRCKTQPDSTSNFSLKNA